MSGPERAALNGLLSRRSVRGYAPRPVDRALIRLVLEAGLAAPSAHDSRPWRFAVFQGAGKGRLLDALAGPFRRDMEAAGLPPETVRARLDRSQRIFRQAPVLILAFSRAQIPFNPLDPTGERERVLAIQSTALACGQMWQAAHALGLGMCWFAAPLFCPEAACGAAGADPERWRPQCLLTLGWPDGTPPREKPPIRWEGSVIWQEES